jgi:predicted enzyme related to lactoylglutathione lyase
MVEGRHIENVSPMGGMLGGQSEADVSLSFRVADIHATVARIRELGGQVLQIDERGSGATASCIDDQGLRFDLYQPAPGFG